MTNLQRLLDEGLFVASYKFALLLSLADLSIEKGDDSGSPLELSTNHIAAKFIQYYWRQAIPYTASDLAGVLQQNTGKQAAIVNLVAAARVGLGDSLAKVDKRGSAWKQLLREVGAVVRVMPLWKLQTIGKERLDFLYQNSGHGSSITLRPGVAYCFQKFYPLISDLVRGSWVRYVRSQNQDILREASDLQAFMFGSERMALAAVRPALLDIQRGRCFYCSNGLGHANTQVDHFVAWVRYPVDLGHNFVLADTRCNNQKRDRLAAFEHLAAWIERNTTFGYQIGEALSSQGMICDLPISNRVAQWAYSQTEMANGLTWLRGDDMIPLKNEWRALLA